MNSKEVLELHDLIQQQSAVIDHQITVISNLLLLIGEYSSVEKFISED